MSKIRKVICIILSLLLLSSSMTVLAKTKEQLQADLNEKGKKRKQIQEDIDNLKSREKTILNEKSIIDNEIVQVEDEIDDLQIVIDETQSNIIKKEDEIKKAQDEIDKYNEVFKIRVRVMYENQNADYLEILLSSKSLSDFMVKMELISEILTNDKKIMTTMAENRQKIVDAKNALVDEKESNESAKGIVEEKRQVLKDKSVQQQALMDELKKEVGEATEDLKEMEAEERAIGNQIKQMEENAAKNPNSIIPKNYGGGRFLWPCASSATSSEFGPRILRGSSNNHTGLDIVAPTGTEIYAAADGVVMMAVHSQVSYGNHLVISHGSGYSTLYGHCSVLLVGAGQNVKKGQVIARVGSTGNSTGSHLHFEVRVNGQAQNPRNFL